MNAFAKADKATFLGFAAEHPEQRYEYLRGRIDGPQVAISLDLAAVYRGIA